MLVSVINRDVIEGVELAAKVVVDEDLVGRHAIRIKLQCEVSAELPTRSIVWLSRIGHKKRGGHIWAHPLSGEKDSVFVVCSS